MLPHVATRSLLRLCAREFLSQKARLCTVRRKMQCSSFTVFQMRQSVAVFCASLREVITERVLKKESKNEVALLWNERCTKSLLPKGYRHTRRRCVLKERSLLRLRGDSPKAEQGPGRGEVDRFVLSLCVMQGVESNYSFFQFLQNRCLVGELSRNRCCEVARHG